MIAHGKTVVVMQAGKYRGRYGWIWGTLAHREHEGVSCALVYMAGAPPAFRKLSNLIEATPIEALCADV